MFSIDKKISEWVSKGIINNTQAEAITTYENSKESKSWAIYGVLGLGAIVIAIGIISVIAANWELFPGYVKIINNFLLLIATAGATYYAFIKNKEVVFEALLLFFILLCLASIGLISQVYHTGGHLYQALLIWSVITFSVMMSTRHFLVAFIWVIGFFAGLSFLATEATFMDSVFLKSTRPIVLCFPYISAILALIFMKFPKYSAQKNAFWVYGLVSLVLGLFSFEVAYSGNLRSYGALTPIVPGAVLGGVAIVAAYFSQFFKRNRLVLISVIAVLYFIAFVSAFYFKVDKVIAAVLTILTLLALSLFLASYGYRKTFQFILSLVGIRFLVLYFQAFGGLAATGIGLIGSGLLIIFMVYLWVKYKERLTHLAEGALNE